MGGDSSLAKFRSSLERNRTKFPISHSIVDFRKKIDTRKSPTLGIRKSRQSLDTVKARPRARELEILFASYSNLANCHSMTYFIPFSLTCMELFNFYSTINPLYERWRLFKRSHHPFFPEKNLTQ